MLSRDELSFLPWCFPFVSGRSADLFFDALRFVVALAQLRVVARHQPHGIAVCLRALLGQRLLAELFELREHRLLAVSAARAAVAALAGLDRVAGAAIEVLAQIAQRELPQDRAVLRHDPVRAHRLVENLLAFARRED